MTKPPRSADLLVNLLLSRPGEIDKLKLDPEKTLRDLASEATTQLIPPITKREVGIYYVVVISLGIVAVSSIIGAIYITAAAPSSAPTKIPDIVTALGSAAIGALAGLLSPSPKE